MNNIKQKWPDVMIIRLFALISIISIAIIYYKYTNYYSCDDIEISLISNKYQVGEVVAFSCHFNQGDEYIWNFGDGSESFEGRAINHIYKSPGRFRVTLQVDGMCIKEKYIVINPLKTIIDVNNYPTFSIPSIAYLDQEITAVDQTKNSEKWEWHFGESFGVDAKTKRARYTYRTTGIKQVTLIVNGRYEFAGKKTITVLPAIKEEVKPLVILEPEAEKPPPIDTTRAPVVPALPKVKYEPTAEKLDNEALAEIFMLISEGKKTINDLLKYTCGSRSVPIRVNDQRTNIEEFCKRINGKKIKIEQIEIMANEKTNCITFIKINYKQSRVGGLFYY